MQEGLEDALCVDVAPAEPHVHHHPPHLGSQQAQGRLDQGAEPAHAHTKGHGVYNVQMRLIVDGKIFEGSHVKKNSVAHGIEHAKCAYAHNKGH
jgi:hypothetical protein